MILLTYRVISDKRFEKLVLLDELYRAILLKDPNWHYFLDPGGITLRFSPKLEKRVLKYFRKNSVKHKRCNNYDPSRHEYSGLNFLGEDMAHLFHDMSVLLTKYPMKTSFFRTLERLNHGLVVMTGINNFYVESQLYMDLAEGRLRLVRMSLWPPRWIYKIYSWIKTKFYKQKPFEDAT